MKIKQILDELLLTPHWDGKECVLELKENKYWWKMLEWFGFWFEYSALALLLPSIGGKAPGPRVGNTKFDYQCRKKVWDFKASPTNSSSPFIKLNSKRNMRECIKTYGHYGIIIAQGIAHYEKDGEFRKWHDDLKGGPTEYTLASRKAGRTNRRRKTSFDLAEISILEFKSLDELDEAIKSGLIKETYVTQPKLDGKTYGYDKYTLDKRKCA